VGRDTYEWLIECTEALKMLLPQYFKRNLSQLATKLFDEKIETERKVN